MKKERKANAIQSLTLLKRTRISQQIFEQLKESIFSGKFKPGDKLPSEGELCEIFGVGRPGVREAMRSLENAGLITVRPGSGGGAFVKKISSVILSETFEGIVKLDKVSMEDLTEARLAIQNCMIPMIIESIQPEDIEALEKHIAKASENLQKGVNESMNMEFHMLLASTCRNRLLLKIDEALLRVMARMASAYEYNYQRKKKVLEGHREIIELLKAGKFEDFARTLKEHIKSAPGFFTSQE